MSEQSDAMSLCNEFVLCAVSCARRVRATVRRTELRTGICAPLSVQPCGRTMRCNRSSTEWAKVLSSLCAGRGCCSRYTTVVIAWPCYFLVQQQGFAQRSAQWTVCAWSFAQCAAMESCAAYCTHGVLHCMIHSSQELCGLLGGLLCSKVLCASPCALVGSYNAK